MDACPHCEGLLIEDDGSDDFLVEGVYGYYCPGCGWSSDDADEEDDLNNLPDDFTPCVKCDGHDACADFGCAIQMGLGHLVKRDEF